MLATLEKTRVCRTCGVRKPIDEYRLIGRWHLRVCNECRLRKMREYHYRHWRGYYQKHSKALIERSRAYYARLSATNLETYGTACSPVYLKRARERIERVRTENMALYGSRKSPEEHEKQRRHFAGLRAKALEYYGGQCECCGESRYHMLTFDHIVGNGYKTGIRAVKLVYAVIREYKESGYPNSKYRILCWNCNMSRGFYGYCPHQGNGHKPYEYKGKSIKLGMIEAYGGKCVLCGETHWEFLTIDHINGGGHRHREKVGNGYRFYKLLKEQGFPKDEYRLLCSNCNCSNKTNQWTKKKEVQADW